MHTDCNTYPLLNANVVVPPDVARSYLSGVDDDAMLILDPSAVHQTLLRKGVHEDVFERRKGDRGGGHGGGPRCGHFGEL